jgi:hypothetical protein
VKALFSAIAVITGLLNIILKINQYEIKRRAKIYHTVGTVPKSNIKIVERGKIDTLNTLIHDCLLSCLGTVTSIKSGGVKLVLWAQTSYLNDMMLSTGE